MIEAIKKIETIRLNLREVTENDVEEIYKIFSDPEVAKYDWFTQIKSRDDAIEIIKRYSKEFQEGDGITWGVELKDTKKLIGICYLSHIHNESRRAEIGYEFSQNIWNKEYDFEDVEAIVKFGLNEMNLNRIEAFITPGNDSSVNLFYKLNFTKEGVVRERDLIKGKFEDRIIMSILKKDIVKNTCSNGNIEAVLSGPSIIKKGSPLDSLKEIMDKYNIDLKFIEKITGIDYILLEHVMETKSLRNLTTTQRFLLSNQIGLLDSFKIVPPLDRVCGILDSLQYNFGLSLDVISKISNVELSKITEIHTNPNLLSYEELFNLSTVALFLHQICMNNALQNRNYSNINS